MKKQVSISRLSFLQKRYKEVLKPAEFGNLLQADPTNTKKYMDWIAVQYLQGSIDLGVLTLKRVNAFLSFYERKKVKNALDFKQKDIHSFKTYQNLEETLAPMVGKEEFFTAKEIKSKSLLQSFKNFKVYNLTTFEESRILGKGTNWCTSINEDEFDEYTASSKLLMFESNFNSQYRLLFDTRTQEFKDQEGKELNLSVFLDGNPALSYYLRKSMKISIKKTVVVADSFESYIENHPEMYR